MTHWRPCGVWNFSVRDIEWNFAESHWSGNSGLSRNWRDCSSSNKRQEEAGDPSPTPIRKHPRIKFLFNFFSFLQKTLMGWNTSWTYLLGAKQAFIDHRRAWMEWKPIWHHVFPPLDLPVLFERGLSNQVQKYQETKYSLIMIWFDFYLMWEKLHCMANGSHLPR